MRIQRLALLTLLVTTGCGPLVRQARPANSQRAACGPMFNRAGIAPRAASDRIVDQVDYEEEIDEPCEQVATPIFYGHYGTCWRQWPKGWTSCAHEAIEVSEAEPLPTVKKPNEQSRSGNDSSLKSAPSLVRLSDVTPHASQAQLRPPNLFVVTEQEHESADDLLAQKVARRLSRMVQARKLGQVTLHVNVMGDTAWVSGDIPTMDQKDVVLKAAEQTEGVRKVYHRLRVGTSASKQRLR